MVKARFTPEDDVIRLSERLWGNSGGRIQDRDSFDLEFDDFMGENLTKDQRMELKDGVFRRLQTEHSDVVSRERLFKKAKGKSLRQDREQTAKKIVKTKKEFIKKGSKKVDLKGYDTKKRRSRRKLDQVGKTKGRIVFAEKSFIIVRKRRVARFRDRKGRFVSVKK